jgi:hypothetical protein
MSSLHSTLRPSPRVRPLAIGIAAALTLVAWLIAPAKPAEQAGGFDGVYTGAVAVTSVRAIPCGVKDFTPSITIADSVASLVYLPDSAGESIVLKAPVLHGGIFAAKGSGELAINMSGTVSRDRIIAKAWAWNCEYALTMKRRATSRAAPPRPACRSKPPVRAPALPFDRPACGSCNRALRRGSLCV